ncbi:GTPase binding protein Rid1 [Phyllosticta citriasiana]|uniref:GTPase binding protein Rid1 n=1 Tax=Phyllosticta citriasiana TaxID=595635 RepID=A0ABR1KRK7_9PEZI
MTDARMALAPERPSHKRHKSTTALKSILTGRHYKRSPSDGAALSAAMPKSKENARPRPHSSHPPSTAMPLLPPDHPHSQNRVLGEIPHRASNQAPPRKSHDDRESKEGKRRSLHKTISSVSLRSLGKGSEKTKDESKEDKRSRNDSRPKKPKSSTNLAAVFSKAKSPREKKPVPIDKENTVPVVSSANTPIWAEFVAKPNGNTHGERSLADEIALYTPTLYSPSKQHNFNGFDQPTLNCERNERKPSRVGSRPSSWHLPRSVSSNSFIETISRKFSDERKAAMGGKTQTIVETWKERMELSSRSSQESASHRKSSEKPKASEDKKQMENALATKRGSRVMAAVAAINGRAKETPAEPPLDEEKIDVEFEAVLDSRNIPDNLRDKMRSLDARVKADFISKHKIENIQTPTEPPARTSMWGTKRKTFGRRTTSDNSSDRVVLDHDDPGNDPKSIRPRSKTFAFKADKAEKRKSAEVTSEKWSKSEDSKPATTSKSLSSATGASFLSRAPKQAIPEDFVFYLRKVQKPEIVEVGKIHKLRLLLRNETVAWVDAFIKKGGMMEIVALLHRIMEIEWREEHEDQLLHEALLCLKGLCTTDLALEKLEEIESTLFPALLAMLFDEEHKGPSEFTTRGVIISLLFAYLSAAPVGGRRERAKSILRLLRGPQKPENARPVPFILEMHQPRPYRTWCQEVVNVTKEVFWIFLHHLNVIPLPSESETEGEFQRVQSHDSYIKQHFPQPRPPVPAAPYVGGVEWDATNYISTHLDLMNGLLAFLPTKAERNELRRELQASGFEKVMGAQLRTCKEKFYGAVHDGLKTYIKAAAADGWEIRDVRMGPRDDRPVSPKKSSPKKKKTNDEPPQIGPPKMELQSLGLSSDLEQKLSPPRKDDKDDFWI